MIIGVEGLSAAEVGLLRTILKLSTQLVMDWSLSEEGPCDVLLTASTLEPERVHAGPPAQIVVPIVRRGEANGRECLERPFRAEDFVALLGRVGPALKPAPVVAPRRSEAATVPSDRRGRLKRWPPSYLVGSSRERIQLATLLSRRSRSARELSAAAGYPESACGAFMLELEKHDLLSWEIAEAASGHPRQAAAASAPRGAAQAHGAPGLLSSIRRRLGLSRNSRSA
ncbi:MULTISPECIES: hypothetical protein [unclassified Polaromonas]|uniref:hypothetical protein n=1 Tax=unclassified Polaromonas TaxID=2638319 RepID=UPI000F07C798|nr:MULTISPECIES: hypothetical protein [unclassified Polaromonas]AYQ28304.1 hypothetical protein DT070_09910 [Polaromonas sp. SP1]QGJ20576.1 hypothetical protein F7R28_20715 [Polaromonas sp. Pch-P]